MQKQDDFLDRRQQPFSETAREESARILLCVGAVFAAILISWPLGDIGFGDDVAYSHLALVLSRTGHFTFNGWEAAMTLQHAYWGALVIRLFGFSLALMRLSTVPFALGAVAICYLLARQAGLKSSAATLVTLVLGLCPIFLPFAVSYMTDVPSLFFFLAALYALIRAAWTPVGWNGYFWLTLGTGAGLLGGTSRQFVWFVPLIVLPYLGWVRRRNARFAVTCLAFWAVSVICVAKITLWFDRQPYVVPTHSLLREVILALKHPAFEIGMLSRFLLLLLCMCFPAALPIIFRSWTETRRSSFGRKILVGGLLLAVVGAVLIHPSLASIPWIASTLNWQGINGDAPLPGRPVVLIRPIRAVVALAVYAAACILLGELIQIPALAKRSLNAFIDPSQTEFAAFAMLLACTVYFSVMLVRGSEFDVFDRYLLPVIPCVSIVLLRLFEAQNPDAAAIWRCTKPFAWGILSIWAAYAILSIQDYWSVARARVAAAKRLEAAGVRRTAIDAGMEYNYWTQLQINGILNWHWMKNPPGAYRPGFGITPDVVPVYRLEYKPIPGESVPTEYGSVPYFSLLPPFHKQVAIDKLLPR